MHTSTLESGARPVLSGNGEGKGRCDIEPSWGIEIRLSVRSERRAAAAAAAGRYAAARSLARSLLHSLRWSRSPGFLSQRKERGEKKWKRLSHEREKTKKRRKEESERAPIASGPLSERSGKLRSQRGRKNERSILTRRTDEVRLGNGDKLESEVFWWTWT